MIKIGLILGYGVGLGNKLNKKSELVVETPYGSSSSPINKEPVNNHELYVIKRHGTDGCIPSYMVNFKANLYALYELGCTHVLSTSICGSLQEEICTGEFVIFDQFIDLSTHKELSYIDKVDLYKLNHSAFNKPFSDEIRNGLIQAAVINGYTVHTKGTVVAVDGPRQSTRAESNLYRSWGADVVNTTTVPEAILAHELNMQYGAVSLCTYFDTWRTDIQPATRGEKDQVLELNKDKFLKMIEHSIDNFELD
jgi:5'-methylthioadenosine phosphorylase